MTLRGRLTSIGRFLAVVAVTYFGLLAVTFFIGRVVPIDPVLAIVGDRAPEHVVQRVRQELGLDLPLYRQFGIYLGKVAQGDFGTSVLTSKPVLQDIARAFPATLELATAGILVGAGLGVPLGVWAAVRRGGWVDQAVRVLGLVGYSVPIFWLGLMALVVFYAKLGWVAGPGRIDVTYEYTDRAADRADPAGHALLAGEWDVLAMRCRTWPCRPRCWAISPGLHQPHDTLFHAARAGAGIRRRGACQGPVEARIIWRHALRNAGAAGHGGGAVLRRLLEGSVLTETVFSWPGLGLYITNSLQNADMNAVLGGTLVVGAIFIGLNLCQRRCCTACSTPGRGRDEQP
jgi:peptide/nickel transport system permease protein